MQAIDKLSEQDCQRKRLEDDNPYATQRGEFAIPFCLTFIRCPSSTLAGKLD